jgi:hypothetical protein
MTPCIEWMGSRTRTGYGQRTINYRRWRAHRWAWTVQHGPIPDGAIVMHTCDNRACINVDHLRIGTQADNLNDMRAKGRGRAKLAATDVAAIRSSLADGETTAVLADRYGVNVKTIRDIRRGSTWNQGAKESA